MTNQRTPGFSVIAADLYDFAARVAPWRPEDAVMVTGAADAVVSLNAALEAAEAERDALRDAIRNAPCALECDSRLQWRENVGQDHLPASQRVGVMDFGTCDCWKAKAAALAGAQEDGPP